MAIIRSAANLAENGTYKSLAKRAAMKRYTLVLLAATLLIFNANIPAVARDFGPTSELGRIKAVVKAKVGQVLHVSASHDWAMCTASNGNVDMSVLLHKIGGQWKIAETDGGAYTADLLHSKGVPSRDTSAILKVYQ